MEEQSMPRLSDWIRRYGCVSRPPNEFDECLSLQSYYRMQRQRVLQQMQRNILPLWTEVKEALKDFCKLQSITSEKELNDLMRQMLDIGREFVGLNSTMDLVESSAVFVLQVFHDSKYVKNILGVTSQQITEFQIMFGSEAVNNSLVNKAFEYSKQIFDFLDPEDRERLFMPFNANRNAFNSNKTVTFLNLINSNVDEEVWGEEYKDIDIDPFADNQQIIVTWESIMDQNEAQDSDKTFALSFQYKHSDNDNSKSRNSSQVKINSTHNKYNIEWLNISLTKYIDNYNDEHNEPFYMNIENLVETVITWIQTIGKSDEELGADLNNLLGDMCFSLIEKIVEYRKQIKNSYNQVFGEEVSFQENVREKVKPQSINTYREKRPAISQSVVVHTEEEKNLKKQIRKIEKKMNKEWNKDIEITNNTISIEDIERMKQEREKALIRAMYGPLFKEENREVLDQREYPYVFDSYIEAKSTPAFISGTKMSLPTGFVRNDQRRWEEISIPAPPPPPDTIIDNFKLIDVETELDEFGKLGFKGIKKLNRIQSIVFKTAYTMNENMVICAPTGAGKTNVAMLAILHEIKSNSPTNSVNDIALDKFKIVYIAPMKALAAEMTENFSKRLQPFGIKVRELTGDMQLTKSEIMSTQILVTTPEKWDVVTRKAKGDVQLLQLVRLIIIDEVHLLQSDRGPVLEALVARTVRYIESSQKCIRMVGLSATLPNYRDVAEFLHVTPKGLFVFDNRFRPVPLSQTFIGCKATQNMQQMHDMDEVTYEKVHEMVAKGHQVMVFVHARNATFKTATLMRDRASKNGHLNVFKCEPEKLIGSEQMMRRARHKNLSELLESGFAIHHAGMLRSDRNLVEKLFRTGVIKVLTCTSTLAWGVNLPAHSVVIRGTEMYDSSQGNFVDISMLDVMQIFGRAGRPQYDTEGHGTIITAHNKLRHYLSLLTNQYPIESNFKKYLTDNMNAEIVSGTITTIDEGIEWIRYTYLFIRMRKNPICYGIGANDLINDHDLYEIRRQLVINSAEDLDKAKMIRYVPESGTLDPTDLGRTASHYYIKYDTIQKFNDMIQEIMDDRLILNMIANAQEFDQLKSREEEFEELTELLHSECKLGVPGGVENKHGKVNILMQTFLSRAKIDSFSLVSDSMFVMQNVNRIARGLFEYVLKRGWALLAEHLLKLSQMFERRMWHFESPLHQFNNEISYEVMQKLERANLSINRIRELSADEIGRLVRHQSYGSIIKRLADTLPNIEIKACLKPITRTVLMVQLELTPCFRWEDKYHGKVCESFWIWLSDTDSNHIYHSELYKFTKKQVLSKETQKLTFNIPLLDAEKLPNQYIVHCSFDRWLGSELDIGISCVNLILPEKYIPYTKLLDLDPLPVTALNNHLYESIYKFSHFNPIQTQIFHTLYHTDSNVLLGAPTGSGKTAAAEIAMFRVFNNNTNSKIVYIAPMKALVRERVDDWKIKIERNLGRKIVELTGDVTPDQRAIKAADLIVTTPEKWDGVSRSWQTRKYVRDVALIIIDEIHLLGEDRGPVLEVIVSRTNFICANTSQTIRIIGLSTAIANAQDLANWLNIKKVGLYNFKPSVRPVPIEVHVSGYPGKNYCPRMALMNKPTYRAILQHSPSKPVLVFVSSRRQTRLTALDLIAFLAVDTDSYRFLHMDRNEMTALLANVRDSNLKITLDFGIGLHHAGLHERDRSLVEELFSNQKIQVLITTATLAWGVNLPAHAVVIKGTEYYDGKKQKYVDFPITDVLQMMGRAGRPQFDTSGVAIVLVHDIKKEYYKKFLYEPFPVESSLLDVMPDHLNAEIVSGTIKTKQDAIEYLNWTYLFRRVMKNPFYYGLESSEPNEVNAFLSSIIDNTLQTLVNDWCITIDEDDRTLRPTSLGRIASYYYLHHSTIRMFHECLADNNCNNEYSALLEVLTNAAEYNELPVRHNEDILNGELANICPMKVNRYTLDSPHTKAHLLLQAHISRLHLQSTDYLTDLKSVLDQAIRVIQAMIDVTALAGSLPTTLKIIGLLQMIIQSRWQHNNPLLTLQNVNEDIVCAIPQQYSSLPNLIQIAIKRNGFNSLVNILRPYISDHMLIEQIYETLMKLPFIEVSLSIVKTNSNEETSNPSIYIPLDSTFKPLTQQTWISVEPNTEYTLVCSFVRLGKKRENSRAVAPKFPKIKDESWFMVLGEIDKSELIALRRVGFIGSKSYPTLQNLTFTTPSITGKFIYTFYFLSDSYLGLDQQYNICLNVE